ncbi:type VI secretion system baseplate subunit TssK (plasmid) [Sinorhizobium medicae]|uniref:type VI secretion system baseplate subunit TssK n=1 Tax=Sinorhizobium medicae TaxID=110321 RepID=UPI002AF6B4D2|nr:type VI secretion system baseplate subunit TssK [Sinorhizobium medicae]WQO48332.1 type VI secretion system baseplate subunit TssK [Sinorhizobium medicae]WQO68748.1 type VI secretion system baseplate subunit TssK [Sinorhizobium medicae]WQO75785.1 type VI secretion system baseplate subunit TssK [Sinorhizobium medicae]WQO94949.1 type VI secretion system baseplate subunit TssK [Sinorhizobium medicae]
MSLDNKVVWSEGLFLRPQHFQQNDHYFEKLVRSRTAVLHGYGWGITHLRLNRELVGLGKIAIEAARGVLPDGTPFSIPEDADQPTPYEVPGNLRDSLIHLAVPLYQPGAVETDARTKIDVATRFEVAVQDSVDTNSGERGSASIEVARLRFHLVPDVADRAGFTCLPIARLIEVRADRQIILDEDYIPPTHDCASSRVLSNLMNEIRGLLYHRGEALAARVSQSGTGGVAEIADFLLLQAINRYEPLFDHLSKAAGVHPVTLYGLMVQLAGELATFSRPEKRPPAFTDYNHEALSHAFMPTIRSIRSSLSTVLEQTAIPLPLRQHKYGIHLAEVSDRSLFTTANFVLAVRADVETERLQREFATQIKVGPAEKIKELVNVALQGITINPLAVAPRQIPFHVGVTYFEIDQQSRLWKDMPHSAGLALHVAGDFPNLEMALWAIRSQ